MRFIIIFLSLFLAQAAIADVEGETDPEYIAARDLWLSGDDLNALHALADLANEGNLAAQIFLGFIPPNTYSHIMASLSREEWKAISRMPNDRFGRRWRSVARERSPLARAISLNGINGRTETQNFIDRFEAAAKYGETRALFQFIELARTIRIGKADFWSDIATREDISPLLAPYTEHMAVFERMSEIANGGNYTEAYKTYDEYMQSDTGIFLSYSRRTLDSGGLSLERYIDVLFHAEQFRPYATICETYCPDESKTCLEAISQTVNREYMFLATLSPVETLLPTGTYTQSPRYEADLLRQVAEHDSINRGHNIPTLRDLNSCAGSLLDRFEK